LSKSSFSTWLLSSNSIWAYPTVLTLHTFGMMVLVGAALMIDLRLLGFGRGIPLQSDRPPVPRDVGRVRAQRGDRDDAVLSPMRPSGGPSLIFWTKLSFVAIGARDGRADPAAQLRKRTPNCCHKRRRKRLAIVSLLAWSAGLPRAGLLRMWPDICPNLQTWRTSRTSTCC